MKYDWKELVRGQERILKNNHCQWNGRTWTRGINGTIEWLSHLGWDRLVIGRNYWEK